MIRWGYVASRLFFIAMVLAGVWLLMNPLLRWAMIYFGQATIGSRVEIESVKTMLPSSRLDVSKIKIGDPDSPLKNLFEIDHATFDIDARSALLRRLVITEGRISGLTFHSGRDSSGQLDPDSAPEDSGPSITDKISDYGRNWIESSVGKLGHQFENDLKSIRLAKDLEERWPREYERLEQQSEDLTRRGKGLAERIEQYADNPLEHLNEFQPTITEIDRVRRDVVLLRTELDRLKKQFAVDRGAILDAKRHDEIYIKEKLHIGELDARTLSEYLLGPEIHAKVATALEWIEWGRKYIPQGDKEERIERTARGIDVIFPGMRSTPEFLIRKLVLDGQGTVNGKRFDFAGSIDDVTHQPHRHDKPATINLTAKGAVEMIAQAILDRRGDQPTEQIHIDIPSLAQPGRTLGKPDNLAVTVSPGRAHINLRLDFAGDTMRGDISFEQHDVQLKPQLQQAYAKEIVASDLAPAFANVNRVHAKVRLDGTIKKPRWKLESNLGPQLAQCLNQAFQGELAARERQLTVKADRLVDEQIAKLEQQLVDRHGDVLKKLELGDKELAMIKTEIASRLGTSSNVLESGKKLFDRLRR